MRRTWVLVAILVVLIPLGGIVSYVRSVRAKAHAAYWGAMSARGQAFEKANRPAGDSGATTSPTAAPTALAPSALSALTAPPELKAPAALQAAGPTATVKKLELAWTETSGASGVLKQIDGCLAIGTGRDVLWQGGDLYLVKAPDAVRRVSLGRRPGWAPSQVGQICFDGYYIWVLLAGAPGTHDDIGNGDAGPRSVSTMLGRIEAPPYLLVVDPESEQTVAFTNADGSLPGGRQSPQFPAQEHWLALSPMAEGKVCAVVKPWGLPAAPATGATPPSGSPLGGTNFWIATLQFGGGDQRAVTAIPAPPGMDLIGWPIDMISVVTDGKTRLVVPRGLTYPALIIDPETRSVTVAKTADKNESIVLAAFGSSLSNCQIAAHDGALWRIKSVWFRAPVLVKSVLPDLNEQSVLKQMPVGLLASSGGDLFIIGERCWRLRGSGPRLEALGGEPPWQFDDYLHSNYIEELQWETADGRNKMVSLSKPPPTPGRDSFFAQRVAPSAVFGLLVMGIDPAKPSGDNGVIYQVTIPAE
jgi:hypothetical protein